jgi:hypothetical protein
MKTISPRAHGFSRREMLVRAGGGFGAVALAALLGDRLSGFADADEGAAAPSDAKVFRPHRARNVIFLFMEGGPSHLDLMDPKPALRKLAGQSLPDSYARVITAMGEFDSPVLPDQRQWRQHGESGLWDQPLGRCLSDEYRDPVCRSTFTRCLGQLWAGE